MKYTLCFSSNAPFNPKTSQLLHCVYLEVVDRGSEKQLQATDNYLNLENLRHSEYNCVSEILTLIYCLHKFK